MFNFHLISSLQIPTLSPTFLLHTSVLPNMSSEKKASNPSVSHDEGLSNHGEKDLEMKHHDDIGFGTSESSDQAYQEHAYQEHGAGIDHKIPQEELIQAKPNLWWSRVRHTLREPFSEFFGVFILILFGDGYVSKPSFFVLG